MSKELVFSFTKKDFRVDWYRASGPGGQKVNKTSSACRITHIESGLAASCQEHRFAQRNKKEAFRKLTTLLLAHYVPKKGKVRGDFNEAHTRTYNESKDFVKDHVTGEKYSYKQTVAKGDMSEMIEDRQNMIDKPDKS